jgi:hypothetical protein
MVDQPSRFGASSELVPVRAVLPAQRPEAGAVLVMRDGSFRMIIRSGAVNFDMKSPAEQGGLTFAFGELVNSLEVDFPLQIVSHSKLLDIDAYVRQYEQRLANERTPPQIRRLIQAHKEHFENQVKTNKLLQREIYVVVPWKGTDGPVEKSITDDIPFAGLLKVVTRNLERKLTQRAPTDLEIATARQQLELRSDQVLERLEQMGIWGRRLDEDEVRRLLYSLYHPSLSERQADPGYDTGGQLFGGFSAESLPEPRRRLTDGAPIEPPKFSR